MCLLPEVTANSDIFLKLDLILINLKGAVLSASSSKTHLAAASACNCILELFLLYCNEVLSKFYQCQRHPCVLGHGSSLCTVIENETDSHVFLNLPVNEDYLVAALAFTRKKFKALEQVQVTVFMFCAFSGQSSE